jgi:hypothetical protein
MYSVGWAKDAMASCFFLISLILIKNGAGKHRNLIDILIIGLLLAFTLDFTFTMYPEYHNTEVGYNRPTYITGLIGTCAIILGIRYI